MDHKDGWWTVVSGAAFFSLFFFPRVRFPVVRQRSEGLIRGGGGVGETQRRKIRR